ncbi:MAG: hypothetical protein D6732_28825 [Methanobacteriota archaeon]|nr:MAG: hypothetical protein D6732_28825 [Euryarchaeota archaeon]
MKIELIIMTFAILVAVGKPVSATWSPGKNEIGPDQDTYISVGGVLGNPDANYGGAENLYIGDSLDGISVSALRFDLSDKGPFSKLEFKADITVFDSATRKIFVNVIPNVIWNELEVTGIDNPFNATDLAFADENDPIVYQSITVTQTTDEIVFSITDFLENATSLTIVLAQEFGSDGWVTMSAKENQYLTAFSNPPHLEYSVKSASGTQTQSETASATFILGFAITSVIFSRKRKAI